MQPRRLLTRSVVALVLGAAACSSGSASSSDLEGEVSSQLEALVGQAPDSVSCPDELPAEVGAEVRCTLTSDETTFGLTVTVTSVDGDVVIFDIVVDDEAQD